MELSSPEYWSGYPFPSPGDLSNPGIEPRSPRLQVDSLSAEPQGKHMSYTSIKKKGWVFPGAQWIRIHLPMQETQVQSLIREYPIFHGATEAVHDNY